MRIFDINVTHRDAGTLLEAKIQADADRRPSTLWYRFEGLDGPLDPTPDPFAVAMLPSCMLDNEGCRIEGRLSSRHLAGLAEAQRILSGWYDFLSPVELSGQPPADESPRQQHRSAGIACCFSGGVDSWYSLIKNRHSLTHLLLVRGFDVGLANDALWNSTRASVEAIARRLGKSLIVCETNLRTVADRGRMSGSRHFDGDFWGRCLHGAALASCAVGLSNTVGELIIPATHSVTVFRPWGSSPILDPHWSNGQIEIYHDGYEASRFEKVERIATFELALETLRVCHNNTSDLNCGRCEKCIRTMIALHLCGVLNRAKTFPDAGALSRVRRIEVQQHLLHYYESFLPRLRTFGDAGLVKSVEAILGRRVSLERSAAGIVRDIRRRRRALWPGQSRSADG